MVGVLSFKCSCFSCKFFCKYGLVLFFFLVCDSSVFMVVEFGWVIEWFSLCRDCVEKKEIKVVVVVSVVLLDLVFVFKC